MTSGQQTPQTANAFGVIGNKSLESEATEVKTVNDADVEAQPDPEAPAAEPAQPDKNTTQVTLLHHYDYNGEPLLPGKTYELPTRLAQSLVTTHRAKNTD